MTTTVAPTGRVRSRDGTEIAYWRLGAGPAVVIVHGGLGSSLGWRPVATRLAERFEVFVYDRRGRGHSGDALRHALEREIEDAEAILTLAERPVALVGHSFGGAVALETARRATPGSLAGVAVYKPGVGIDGAIALAEIERMQVLIEQDEADAALDIGLDALDAAGLVSADPRPPGVRRPDAVLALAPTVPRELRALTAPSLEHDRYAALALPVLVLAGRRSPARQRRNCERLAATLSNAKLTWLDGLGHVAHTAAPGVVAAELVAFLDRETTARPFRPQRWTTERARSDAPLAAAAGRGAASPRTS